MDLNKRVKGMILVILGTTLWGASGTVAQYLFKFKGVSPDWLVVTRSLVSGLLILSYSLLKDKTNTLGIWKDKESAISLVIFSIFGIVGTQYTYFSAISYGNAATATILQFLSPVLICLYLSFINRRVPSGKEIMSILLAMFGTMFIITKGHFNSISISKGAFFWGIGAALTLSFYTLQPGKLLKNYGSNIILGWSMLIGGFVLSFKHAPWKITCDSSIGSILGIIFIIIFGTIIAFCLYLESLKCLLATEASILSSFEPLSAAVLSVVCLHEKVVLAQWIGSFCIIATVILLAFSGKKANEI